MSGLPLPVASLEALEAILWSPETPAVAELIPDKGREGRPRKYTPFMWIVYEAAIDKIWETARQVESEFGHPIIWGFMQSIVKEVFPDDSGMWLPDEPMRRCHYAYARKYLKDPEFLKARQRVHMEQGIMIARTVGLLDPDGPGSYAQPNLDRMVHMDGKAVTAMFKAKEGETRVDKSTGEIKQVRYDPDAHVEVEGDGNDEWGSRFLMASVRSEEPGVRVNLAVDHVPKEGAGGEAGVAMEIFEEMAALAPGILGVISDKVLRGVHIDTLMRKLGWITVAGVAAKENPGRKGHRTGPRVAKERLLDIRPVTLPTGETVEVAIYGRDGAGGIMELDETGKLQFVPLTPVRRLKRGKPGRYRFYKEFELPNEYGGGIVRVSVTRTPEDKAKRLNRSEYIRLFAKSDPAFKRLYGRRNDAETLNDIAERTLHLKKAHSIGYRGQLADLLAFALAENAVVLHRHRRRRKLPDAA